MGGKAYYAGLCRVHMRARHREDTNTAMNMEVH